MNDKQLLDHLSQADEYAPLMPLPEQIHTRSRALEVLDRRIAMDPTKLARLDPDTRLRDRGWLIAAAVFAAVMIAGVALLAALNSTQSAPPATTPSIPLIGVGDDAVSAEAFILIEEAYAAHSRGDAGAWFRAFFPPGNRDQKNWWADVYVAYALADEQFEVSQCISHGFGDWAGISADEPFFEEDTVATGFRFECAVTESNAFHDAGGIMVDIVHDWVVAEGVIVAAISGGDFDAPDAFNQDFRNWLLANHYDVFTRMETLPWLFPNKASIITALEYVHLFVEDSTDWPRPSSE
jgi:hypothetical protein